MQIRSGIAVILFNCLSQIAPACAQIWRNANSTLPAAQSSFCQAIDSADVAYEAARYQYYHEGNGLIQDKVAADMAKILKERDHAIYSIISGQSPEIDNWAIRITKVSSAKALFSDKASQSVTLSGTTYCRTKTTFVDDMPNSPGLVAALSRFSIGDTMLVKGNLIGHGGTHFDGSPNSLDSGLEWSITEGGAMQSPEYHISILEFSHVAQ